jgi:phosphoribosylformylglycinamidine synthase
MKKVRALVLTGYGLNCDYETDFALKLAGAESHRIHINELIAASHADKPQSLNDFHILVFGGGFSWADDHGAGVLMAAKLRRHLGDQLERFVSEGNLLLGICKGFQALVNLGLLPGFQSRGRERTVAVTYNDSGNFIDAWVNLKVNSDSPCVFTTDIDHLELPVRHGEGKFYAGNDVLGDLLESNQVVLQYAGEDGKPACGEWPNNPNGSLQDIAGMCDPTGRIFGLMPHPEAFNHFTNHPNWTYLKETLARQGKTEIPPEGDGIKVFRNAVEYVKGTLS